jgi:hypothetical protein
LSFANSHPFPGALTDAIGNSKLGNLHIDDIHSAINKVSLQRHRAISSFHDPHGRPSRICYSGIDFNRKISILVPLSGYLRIFHYFTQFRKRSAGPSHGINGLAYYDFVSY